MQPVNKICTTQLMSRAACARQPILTRRCVAPVMQMWPACVSWQSSRPVLQAAASIVRATARNPHCESAVAGS
eukprot:6879161-Alexandrium_andersonii.AAC.1